MKMNSKTVISRAVIIGLLAAVTLWSSADAKSLGGLVGKAVAKRLAQKQFASKAAVKKVVRKDAVRDAATKVKPLSKARTVRRYTSRRKARQALRHGLAPGTHMTSRIPRGRPISAKTAQRRYGLPTKPQVRMTVRVPKGHPVRKNKVLGGQSGRGEITSTEVIRKKQILRVDRLR